MSESAISPPPPSQDRAGGTEPSREGGPAEGRIDVRAVLARDPDLRPADLVALLCADQVKRWRRGERIPAEAYLQLHPSLQGDKEDALALVLGELVLREELGEAPALEEFLWRFPRFAEQLRRQTAARSAARSKDKPAEASGKASAALQGVRFGTLAAPSEEPAFPRPTAAVSVWAPDAPDMPSGPTISLAGVPPLVQTMPGPALEGVLPAGSNDLDATVIAPPIPVRTPRPAAAPDPAIVPGYEILGVLGRGGMGVVYEARQIALKRTVALKMILGGVHASPGQLARFRVEAEAVAHLQHPNIVQIHEVGQHNGLPYFSLEFVGGGSLDQHLAGVPQSARPAARLVEKLARAMHHAHQRGIIHRDLKPANVLLTAAPEEPPPAKDSALHAHGEASGSSHSGTGIFWGEPKITDFGLAKQLEDDSNQTRSGAVLGTPSYMAPEQARGEIHAIGPATDVYALGAILYEMLTGRPPFRAARPLDTVQQVISQDPVAPSRLQPKVPRDLETICLKCLEKEPKKRYASALEMAEDLGRFQAGEPIQARPTSTMERLVKWARRRPLLAALAGVIALLIVSLLVGGFWYNRQVRAERDRAEANFHMALQAVDELVREVGAEDLANEPRMEQKRKKLLARALEYFQEFLKQKEDDPVVRKKAGQAYKQMGDVLRLLGRTQEAQDAYEKAIDHLSRLAEDFPKKPEYRQYLAQSYNWLGEVDRGTERLAKAKKAYESALKIQEQLVAESPLDAGYRKDQARSYYNLGIVLKDTNQPRQAERAFHQAIGILKQIRSRFPEEPTYRQELARAFLNLSLVLQSRDMNQALTANADALDLMKPLAEKPPQPPEYRHELAILYNNRAILLLHAGGHGGAPAQKAVSFYKKAEQENRRARDIFLKLVADFPSVPAYQKELANTYNIRGAIHYQTEEGQKTRARGAWKQAEVLWRKLAQGDSRVADYQAKLAETIVNLGLLLHREKDHVGARAKYEEAEGHLQKALDVNREKPDYLNALFTLRWNLADTQVQLKDHKAAARTAAALSKTLPDNGRGYYLAACFLARCAGLVANDTKLPVKERALLKEQYGHQAVEMLTEAVARKHRFDWGDKNLDPIRDRQGFRKLAGPSNGP
jgi:serine/threonine protein kinase